MMRVIVDEQEALARVLDLEAATRVLKVAQRCRDLLERDAELRRERDDAERVADVMPAGNVQDRFAELSRRVGKRRRRDAKSFSSMSTPR